MTRDSVDQSADRLLNGSPYVGYCYSYPHKTAYRAIRPVQTLEETWRDERLDSLFLYLHVPFCEHRCGYCNLFSLSRPSAERIESYLDGLRRQAESFRRQVPDARFEQIAIGGGTPTFLSIDLLERLLSVATDVMGAKPADVEVSCEASPDSVDVEKLVLLRSWGVDRISLGVQSFDARDARSMGRPQRSETVMRSLDMVRASGFPTLNVDLIYGGEHQTISRWLASIETALDWAPEEFYLYPLYVRPLTRLGRSARQWDDVRLESYRQGRSLLLDRGYRQISMRMFQKIDTVQQKDPVQQKEKETVYHCQEDGMVGLGCGARSYTRRLHYSFEYAIGSSVVADILDHYNCRDQGSFARVDYGFPLDDDDQRRRYAIITLLQVEGISRADYRRRFQSDVLDDLPELNTLVCLGLGIVTPERIQLTSSGLERSDTIGPWLYSTRVQHRMESYAWR